MKDWQRIREAIDACRPESQDLANPELQDVADAVRSDPRARQTYERTQQLDATLRRAFQQVEVPEGLQDRLLSRLGLQTGIELATSAPTAPAASAELSSPVAAPRRSRRAIFMIGVPAIAAAVIACVIYFMQPSQITLPQLAQLAIGWSSSLHQDTSAWRSFEDAQAPRRFPGANRWKMIATDLDSQTLVFDCSSRSGRLYVFRLQPGRTQIPLPPLFQTLNTSGQWRVGAWKRNDAVFIAVTDQPDLLRQFRSQVSPT